MGAAVVPHRNTPPILDAAEHDFDLVALFVELFTVAALLLAVVARRDARLDAVLLQGSDQPVRVIPHGRRSDVVHEGDWGAGISRPCNRSFARRSATAAPACRCRRTRRAAWSSAPLSSGRYGDKHPFLSRLAAVRWALRCVASIISCLVPSGLFASSVNIKSNTPIRLQRTKRLYSVLCGP